MTIADVILTKQGLVFVEKGTHQTAAKVMQAVDLELGKLGYALSFKLRAQLATLDPNQLAATVKWMIASLAQHTGAAQWHEPLFRSFPDGIPESTLGLWLEKFLIHWLTWDDEPCLFCRGEGTTHVLRPCMHVICDRCFDGGSYSRCPCCERHVDRSSPFFQASEVRTPSRRERVKYKLIDLGDGTEARQLFDSLCARKQALSADDRMTLSIIANEKGAQILEWLPEQIPLKENIALIFGSLLTGSRQPQLILESASPYLKTATDVLRLLAAYSGADPALQGERITRTTRHSKKVRADAELIRRFQVHKMSKSLRRAVLGLLEAMPFEHLAEDMLRHQSYWVWLGKFLHPYDYANRFPQVALAFSIIRQTNSRHDRLGKLLYEEARQHDHIEDGYNNRSTYRTFRTFASRLENAADRGNGIMFAKIAQERPGELARRLDHALRLVHANGQDAEPVVEAFCARVELMSTPVLVTLRNLLPARLEPTTVRIFWPKGESAKGTAVPDNRGLLAEEAVKPLVAAIEVELLRRFAEKPKFVDGILDRALSTVIAPFNERTASRGSLLTRGSRVTIPNGKVLRFFLHWCQPEDGQRTDLDLSVGFFNASWQLVGRTSFRQLKFSSRNHDIGVHSGDCQDAPGPDGGTEFVDLHIERAREVGIRYAAMVVNAWRGLSFSELERCYAGVMERSDDHGLHFDPRTVVHKFDLQGDNGNFIPAVVDLSTGELHWMDIYQKGSDAFNSVESAAEEIAKTCPDLIEYFGTGARPSVFDLGLLHAAARCENVYVRGNRTVHGFSRKPTEDAIKFLRRINAGVPDERLHSVPSFGGGVFACMFHGDVELPGDNNTCYALLREKQTGVIAASDLLS